MRVTPMAVSHSLYFILNIDKGGYFYEGLKQLNAKFILATYAFIMSIFTRHVLAKLIHNYN